MAAHADTVSDDDETKVEEILAMILTSNASTVRNLVKLERTRICPDTNGLYYNRSSTSIVSAVRATEKNRSHSLYANSTRRQQFLYILWYNIIDSIQSYSTSVAIKDQMHVRAPSSSEMLCDGGGRFLKAPMPPKMRQRST